MGVFWDWRWGTSGHGVPEYMAFDVIQAWWPHPSEILTFDKPGGSEMAKYPDNQTATLKTHTLIPTHGNPHTDTHALITTF